MDYHVDNQALIETLLYWDEPTVFGLARWAVMLLALFLISLVFAMAVRS